MALTKIWNDAQIYKTDNRHNNSKCSSRSARQTFIILHPGKANNLPKKTPISKTIISSYFDGISHLRPDPRCMIICHGIMMVRSTFLSVYHVRLTTLTLNEQLKTEYTEQTKYFNNSVSLTLALGWCMKSKYRRNLFGSKSSLIKSCISHRQWKRIELRERWEDRDMPHATYFTFSFLYEIRWGSSVTVLSYSMLTYHYYAIVTFCYG